MNLTKKNIISEVHLAKVDVNLSFKPLIMCLHHFLFLTLATAEPKTCFARKCLPIQQILF